MTVMSRKKSRISLGKNHHFQEGRRCSHLKHACIVQMMDGCENTAILAAQQMKYHYQYVSRTSVRIELIPENSKEMEQVSALTDQQMDHPQLSALYQKGLQHYKQNAMLINIRFMNFPKVALCSHT